MTTYLKSLSLFLLCLLLAISPSKAMHKNQKPGPIRRGFADVIYLANPNNYLPKDFRSKYIVTSIAGATAYTAIRHQNKIAIAGKALLTNIGSNPKVQENIVIGAASLFVGYNFMNFVNDIFNEKVLSYKSHEYDQLTALIKYNSKTFQYLVDPECIARKIITATGTLGFSAAMYRIIPIIYSNTEPIITFAAKNSLAIVQKALPIIKQ